MDLGEATTAAVQWRIMQDAAKAEADAARANLDELMATQGSERQRAVNAAGQTAGVASRLPPRQVGEVYDLDALLAWTRTHRPDEIIETLNPAWVRYLEQNAAAFGVASDPETGEVIPGVRGVTRPGGLRLTVNPAAREVVRRLMRDSLGNDRLLIEGDGDGVFEQ